jgi:hypothetical protein
VVLRGTKQRGGAKRPHPSERRSVSCPSSRSNRSETFEELLDQVEQFLHECAKRRRAHANCQHRRVYITCKPWYLASSTLYTSMIHCTQSHQFGSTNSVVHALERLLACRGQDRSRRALVTLCSPAQPPELVRPRPHLLPVRARTDPHERGRELRRIDLRLRPAVRVDAVPERLDPGGERVEVVPPVAESVTVGGRQRDQLGVLRKDDLRDPGAVGSSQSHGTCITSQLGPLGRFVHRICKHVSAPRSPVMSSQSLTCASMMDKHSHVRVLQHRQRRRLDPLLHSHPLPPLRR